MKKQQLIHWVHALGPGIITAALVFGPSKMTVATKLGAEFGYDLLWVVVTAIFFMMVYTAMSARIGLASEVSILDLIRKKWGSPAGVVIGIGVFLVAACFQAGNSIGAGIALEELTHTPRTPWILFFNLAGLVLLFFRSFYRVLEKVMLFLILLMLFAFVVTAITTRPPLAAVITGLEPTVPAGSWQLVTALTASCFALVAAFYQAYLIQERKRKEPEGTVTDRSFPGLLILGIMTALVMICAASVMHPQGLQVSNASDMGRALEPLFGHYASVFFLIGLFGASFSSLIGNSTLGGTIFSDALGYGSRLDSRSVRWLIALIMATGAGVAIAFGSLPIQLIIIAQSITIFIIPMIGLALFLIANDRSIMGTRANGLFSNLAGVLGLVLVVTLAVHSFNLLFLK
ncbi:MAG: Nramp family divalent metal transporter [Saprospiraceae bacterium]|nr:Nramp family divalent metal transporter [Saprospiraceae bacterium]